MDRGDYTKYLDEKLLLLITTLMLLFLPYPLQEAHSLKTVLVGVVTMKKMKTMYMCLLKYTFLFAEFL